MSQMRYLVSTYGSHPAPTFAVAVGFGFDRNAAPDLPDGAVLTQKRLSRFPRVDEMEMITKNDHYACLI
jgi:hypothetical protein